MTYTEAMIALAEMLSCGSDDPRLRVVANEMGNLGARLAESEARLVSCNQAAEENASIARSYLGRAEAAEAERDDLLGALRDVSQAIHSDGTLCWCVYERMIHPHDDPQDALPLEENGHHRSCNRARAAIAKVTK